MSGALVSLSLNVSRETANEKFTGKHTRFFLKVLNILRDKENLVKILW